jgi:hypothetical protein
MRNSFSDLFNNSSSSSAKLSDEKVFESTDIKNISINDLHTNINIIPTLESNIKVQLYGLLENKQEPDFNLLTSTDNGNLMIEVQSIKNMSLSWKGEHRLDVFIPQSYSKDLNIKTSEGTVNGGSNKVTINSESGSVVVGA